MAAKVLILTSEEMLSNCSSSVIAQGWQNKLSTFEEMIEAPCNADKNVKSMKIRSGSVFFAIIKLSFKRRAKFINIKGLITNDISDLTFVERYVIFFVISVEENEMDTDHEERVTAGGKKLLCGKIEILWNRLRAEWLVVLKLKIGRAHV